MSRKVRVVYEMTADGPVAVAAYSTAVAVGEDTLATSDISVQMTSHGRVTITSGTSTATASASSPTGGTTYATADTGVVSDSDILRTSTTTQSGTGEADGSSWWLETSKTRFFSIDIEGIDIGGGPVSIDTTKNEVVVSQAETVDGNVAILDVEATVFGTDTYAAVEAEILTVEDQLSSTNVTVLTASDGYWG